VGNKAGLVHLLDPESWKLPATLIDDWKTITVGGVAIVGAIGTALKYGSKPIRWALSKVSQPKGAGVNALLGGGRPLRFVQNEQQSFWGPAGSPIKPATQIAGHWHVTNTTDLTVVLLRAHLDGHDHQAQMIATSGFRDRVYARLTPIPAESMAQVTVNFMCSPPIISGTEPLIVDVIFTDNYEREHRVPSRFRYIRA
jgi:hypothetical protein